LVIILIILGLSIWIVNQYERGVVFRVGKVIGVKEPGLRLIIPLIDRMVNASLTDSYYAYTFSEDCYIRQMFQQMLAAVAYFKIVDPYKAVVEVENYIRAVNQISQTTIRSVVGQFNLDEIPLRNTLKLT
jgi:regulator of protease activity HflC (stomatin/prohibitin superfamily)